MMKINIGFLGSHIARCVVPYWKMSDFGGVEVSRLVGAWLAGRASLKMLEPKDPIRPRWGVKKRKRFWLPPKKDLLSVGWSFGKGSAELKNEYNATLQHGCRLCW